MNCSSPAQDDAHDALDLRMWVRLLACARIIEKTLRRRFEEMDTTLPRFDAMAALDRAPRGLTMSGLSRELLVSNGNVTAIVRLLEKQGFVVVKPDPADGRITLVSLTASGKKRFRILAKAHSGWVDEAVSGMPLEDRRHLLVLLDKLKGSLSSK